MPAPAIAAALARFLPMLESLASSGGAASGLGAGVAAGEGGGLLASVGRLLGGAKPFANAAELGGGLRQISDLTQLIGTAKQAIDSSRGQQEQISAKARHDEKYFMTADPGHRDQLARLAHEQQQHQQSMRAAQQQLQLLQMRAVITTDPAAAQAANIGRVGTIAGVGAAAVSLAPSMLRNSAPVQIAGNMTQAGANLGGNFATPVAGQIIGQAVGSFGKIAGTLNPVNMGMSALRGPFGPLQELAKAGVEIAKLPGRIQEWSESLLESQRNLSRFDGTFAQMFAERDRRGIVRGMASAGRTAGTSSELSSSLDDLQDKLQPLKDSMTNVVGKGLNMGVELLSKLLGKVEGLYEASKEIPLIGKAILSIEERIKSLEARHKAGGADLGQALLRDLELHDARRPRSAPRR